MKKLLFLILIPALACGQLTKPGTTAVDQTARDAAAAASTTAGGKLDTAKAFKWTFGAQAGDSLRFVSGTGITLTKTGNALTVTNSGVTSATRTVPAYPNDTTQFLRGDSTWQAPTSTSGGDITAVTAGTGLSGGGITGAVTVNVDTAVIATVYDLGSYAPTTNATFSGITTFSSSLTGRAILTTGILTAAASDTVGLASALALKSPLASPTFTGNPVFTLGSDATGDMWYRASLTGYMTRLGIGSTGQVLSVSGGIPAWRAPDTTGLGTSLATKAGINTLGNRAYDSTGLAVDKFLGYNGVVWTPKSAGSVSSGAGVTFYFDDSSSNVSGKYILARYPISRTEEHDSVNTNGGNATLDTVFIESYLSDALGGSQIDGGEWAFYVGNKVTISTGTSQILFDIYKRTAAGDTTKLFSIASGDLNSTVGAVTEVKTVQAAFAISSTDRMLVRVWGTTTHNGNVGVVFIHNGTSLYSHISTPLVTRHNDLAGLQGGTAGEYYHLTSTAYTNVDSMVKIQSTSGYLVRDSSNVIVNARYYVPQILLASITLDSSCQFTADTTQIGYVQYKSVIDTIILYSNSTVSLTPRFLIGSTPAVTSPASFTTARAATRISTFNASAVDARTMLHLVFDAITTKATKFSAYIYGHPVP